ncbi:carbon-nitrogen hydrolase family protein [Aestuariivirga litoralis]|uniref:Carbon-nitrogen hydrolase family protein n=1 Tax=Aestuariivirga litoralis TaxID=2650924 RepID=A0A2W2AX99_9HYPH|nr:carbon-nitrogen hydrolase family protein [Aestuariivirga litoralis]PZF77250.1 carbon-nitrogen hydrolase family protein [Aestuariivirga litoralis]
MSFIAACVQSTATPDIQNDIRVLTGFIREAASKGARFIATPEYCAGLDTKGGKLYPVAFVEAEHPVLPAMQALAKDLKVWLLIGSIGVKAPDGKIFNRSFMLSPSGAIAARYDKIHLFDIDLGEGRVYHESATIEAGQSAVIAPCAEGMIGLSICYDIRFPHLYRAYAQGGAELIAAPAAFTRVTGAAHWHVLQRARAIENGAYVVAPGQCGTLSGGADCYGHSLIVDPWGRVLADGGTEPGVVTAEIDLALVAETRGRIPSLTHDRRFSPACLATPEAS